MQNREDETKSIPIENRRFDTLSYLIAGTEPCASVCYWDGKVHVAYNRNIKENLSLAKDCFEFMKTFSLSGQDYTLVREKIITVSTLLSVKGALERGQEGRQEEIVRINMALDAIEGLYTQLPGITQSLDILSQKTWDKKISGGKKEKEKEKERKKRLIAESVSALKFKGDNEYKNLSADAKRKKLILYAEQKQTEWDDPIKLCKSKYDKKTQEITLSFNKIIEFLKDTQDVRWTHIGSKESVHKGNVYDIVRSEALAYSNAITKEDDNGVHAEMKILTFILHKLLEKRIIMEMKPLYLGISKLSCYSCGSVFSALSEKFNFVIRGKHYNSYPWKAPSKLQGLLVQFQIRLTLSELEKLEVLTGNKEYWDGSDVESEAGPSSISAQAASSSSSIPEGSVSEKVKDRDAKGKGRSDDQNLQLTERLDWAQNMPEGMSLRDWIAQHKYECDMGSILKAESDMEESDKRSAVYRAVKESETFLLGVASHGSSHINMVRMLTHLIKEQNIEGDVAIALERAEGQAFGMGDLRLMAAFLLSKASMMGLPGGITNSVIYHEALLYLVARSIGIAVHGIDIDPLLSVREREIHMLDEVKKLSKYYDQVVTLTGMYHVQFLSQALLEFGYKVSTKGSCSRKQSVLQLQQLGIKGGLMLENNTTFNDQQDHFITAIMYGDLQAAMQEAETSKIDVASRYDALQIAAERGYETIVRWLLGYQFDDLSIEFALSAAIMNTRLNVISTVLKKRPDLIISAFCAAVEGAKLEVFRMLIAESAGRSIEKVSSVILHAATEAPKEHRKEFISELCRISPGLALATIKDDLGRSLWSIVAQDGDTDLLEYCIQQGCDKNEIFGVTLQTALHWAVMRQNAVSVEMLVNNGADLQIKDAGGHTPAELAREMCSNHKGSTELEQRIKSAKQDTKAVKLLDGQQIKSTKQDTKARKVQSDVRQDKAVFFFSEMDTFRSLLKQKLRITSRIYLRRDKCESALMTSAQEITGDSYLKLSLTSVKNHPDFYIVPKKVTKHTKDGEALITTQSLMI